MIHKHKLNNQGFESVFDDLMDPDPYSENGTGSIYRNLKTLFFFLFSGRMIIFKLQKSNWKFYLKTISGLERKINIESGFRFLDRIQIRIKTNHNFRTIKKKKNWIRIQNFGLDPDPYKNKSQARFLYNLNKHLIFLIY